MPPKNEKTTAMTETKPNLPALSAADQKEMYGDIDQQDIVVPRLTMLQQQSPEVGNRLGFAGNFFIVGLNQNLGEEIEFIPLMRNRSRIRWKPLTEGGGILCRSFDSKLGAGDPGGDCNTCKLKEWDGMKAPSCDLYENVIVLLRNNPTSIPLAFSGAKTKLKPMKELNTLFLSQMQQNLPLYAKSFIAKSVAKASKSSGLKYYSFQVTPGNNNQVLPADEIAAAARAFQSIRGLHLAVDAERMDSAPQNSEI